ncbi:hypothetical protein A7M79_00300 [Acinetobacter baumannii]|uniref:hypothetical protein n=1 Tax=Acinetobacter baumannii TaxID=470 RepID=UPI0008DD9F79|nr:hypothetical protein [Acinetobacter baumannii]OIH11964.1 hypothetical protein A7M79_00300 [Acinetobacter baumannii]
MALMAFNPFCVEFHPEHLPMINYFEFDSETFVAPDSDKPKVGHIPDVLNMSMKDLRDFYPELSHWNTFVIYIAYHQYAEDFNLEHNDPCETERNELFLNYCCWRQTRGEFDPLRHLSQIGLANEWKTATSKVYLSDITQCFRCESRALLIQTPNIYKSDETGLLVEGDQNGIYADSKHVLKFTCLKCGHEYSSDEITSLKQVIKKPVV